MDDGKVLQYETSDIVIGNKNITEAIETNNDLLFSETYVVVGTKLKANKVHANYDLIVISDLEVTDIEVNGKLIVNGNLRAEKIHCLKLICTGKVQADFLQCDEDVVARTVSINTIQVQGSILVMDSFIVDEKCDVNKNILAGEGVSGSGMLRAENAVAGDYFDFDGEINANIYEIATMFGTVVASKKSSENMEQTDFGLILAQYLDDFWDSVIEEEEDYILEEISKCAKIQKISFNELYYLFCEISRISYLDAIGNLRDYLLVKYAEDVFPQVIQEYETIEHVFKDMINQVRVDDLVYSADNIMQFAFSMKILATVLVSDREAYADKIFSSIGLKYSFVKKQFERNLL